MTQQHSKLTKAILMQLLNTQSYYLSTTRIGKVEFRESIDHLLDSVITKEENFKV